MRVHTVQYWEKQILAEKKNPNKNNRNNDPQNDEELMNYQLAEFYITVNSNKTKLVA